MTAPIQEDTRLERLAALARIELTADRSDTDVFARVTELATELLPASVGSSLVLWNAFEEQFELAATTVPGQVDEVNFRPDGVTRRIVETQEPVVVRDASESLPGDREKMIKAGYESYIGVPVEAEGRIIGVLYAMDAEARDYTDDDVEFLRVLASRASVASTQSRMLVETQSARERSEALAWAANAVIAAEDLTEVLESVVEGVAAAVDADRVYLVVMDPKARRIKHHVIAGLGDEPPANFDDIMAGLTGWVMRERRVAISNGIDHDDRQEPHIQERRKARGGGPQLVAPLRSGERILGTLTALRPNTRPMFSEADIDLVVAMASQTAVAIENAQLLASTQSSLRETEVMYRVSQRLIDADGPSVMLDAVAEGALEALAAHYVVMATFDVDDRLITDQSVAGSIEKIGSFEELSEGPLGSVISTREATMISADPDRTAQPGPIVAVPLKAHDSILGLLAAGHTDVHDDFNHHHLELLTTLAAQSSVALENTRLFQEVQRLAVTDDLTSLHSRRHLFELGEREFAQAVRFRTPLSAILFDLDHFKKVNDTLGHVVGDEVLAGVAARCLEVVRDIDVLGRYGGEEFAAVLPQTKMEQAMVIAERLLVAVGDEPIETGRGPVAVTISAGVAEMGPGVHDLKGLLDNADAAMYEAKAAGRNRVKSHQG